MSSDFDEDFNSIEDMKTQYVFTVDHEAAGKRLDRYLSEEIAQYDDSISRSRIKSLLESGMVKLGNTAVSSAAKKVQAKEEYKIIIPEPEKWYISPVEMPLDIVFEDDDLLVINKAAGLTVHPGAGDTGATLAHGLLAYCGDSLSGIGGVQRPGIVHRLDKDTSGLMVVAKNDKAHNFLSAQLKDKSLYRLYEAVICGSPSKNQGSVEGNIGRHPKNRKKMTVLKDSGKPARTHYKVINKYKTASYSGSGEYFSHIECQLETGRTHQIRVHMAHIGHPLVGDPVYGKKMGKNSPDFARNFKKQALHAKTIGFVHPSTGNNMQLTSDLPLDFMELIQNFKEQSI